MITGADSFEVRASYVTIDCFILRPTNGSAVTISGNRLEGIRITNVHVDDERGTCIQAIRAQQSAVANFVRGLYVAFSYFTRCRVPISVTANESTFEYNETFRNRGRGDTDHMRIFGDGITIRGNYMHGNTIADCLGAACHIDCIQTYYHGGPWGILKNAVIEQNTCFNVHQGFLAQGTVGTHKNITLRNNVWARRPADDKSRFSWCMLVEGVVDVAMVHNTCAEGAVGCRGYAGVASTCRIQSNIFDGASYPIPVQLEAAGQPIGVVVVTGNLFFRRDRPLASSIYPENVWNADPLFVDPDGGDFGLLPASPAIDASTADITIRSTWKNSRQQAGYRSLRTSASGPPGA